MRYRPCGPSAALLKQFEGLALDVVEPEVPGGNQGLPKQVAGTGGVGGLPAAEHQAGPLQPGTGEEGRGREGGVDAGGDGEMVGGVGVTFEGDGEEAEVVVDRAAGVAEHAGHDPLVGGEQVVERGGAISVPEPGACF